MRALTTSQYVIQLQETPINDWEAFNRLETSIIKGEFHKFNAPMIQEATTVGEFGLEIGHDESKWPKTLEIQGEGVRTGEVLVSNDGTDCDLNPAFEIVANDTDTYTDNQFRKELVEISVQHNQVNGMPMRDVITYFMVMCYSPCARDIPQMSKQDFVTFLKVGFLGCPSPGKIGFDRFEPGATLDIFHRFKTFSIAGSYDTKKGKNEKYLRLVTENFKGFDFDTHRKNFRSVDSSRLPEIIKRYKNEIQFLQSLQK